MPLIQKKTKMELVRRRNENFPEDSPRIGIGMKKMELVNCVEKSNSNKKDDRNCCRLIIRRMKKQDWTKLIELFDGADNNDKDENTNQLQLFSWNYASGEADVHFNIGNGWTDGFYVAEDKKTGVLLGYVFAAYHGISDAYIGPCRIRNGSLSKNQRISIEKKLFHAAYNYSNKRNHIFMDITRALSIHYQDRLFQFQQTDQQVFRYFGIPQNWERLPVVQSGIYICHAQMMRVEDVAEFDETICGENRSKWLRQFLVHSNEYNQIPKSVALVVTDRCGHMQGYGCVRPGAVMPKIGPVYARDWKIFFHLFRNLMGSWRDAREKGVELCISSSNRRAVYLIENILKLKRSHDQSSKLYYCGIGIGTGNGIGIGTGTGTAVDGLKNKIRWDQAFLLSNCDTQLV